MEPPLLDVPPSPPRWSRIPFDILYGLQGREKRSRIATVVPRTSINDLPEPILAMIFACISDARSRNSMSVVCMEWYALERATRTKLCLRGCVGHLHLIPRSFQAVECLDLSDCSPWGYSLFQSIPERGALVGHVLKQAFPRVKDMTIYVRDVRDIDMVACFWPDVQILKLVRWHQRPTEPEEASGLGMEFRFLMQTCRSLRNLDLSEFYCWTEDIPYALMVEPSISGNLCSLNLLKVSVEGFKASELGAITSACPRLQELKVVLVFDPRLLDFVDDDALLHLGTACKNLRVLHLIDNGAFGDAQGDPDDDFGSNEDAPIGKRGLQGLFQALPLLEDLAIVLSQNVRHARPILEVLAAHCKRLTSLCLGHFHGLCEGPRPDGVALCLGLRDLKIRCCADLSDIGLVTIGSGCTRLYKLGLQFCRKISRAGLFFLARQLRYTLVDVQVTCCLQMNAVNTLWALQPIQRTIESLDMDFIVDSASITKELDSKRETVLLSSPTAAIKVGAESVGPSAASTSFVQAGGVSPIGSLDLNTTLVYSEMDLPENAVPNFALDFQEEIWSKLRRVSLWAPIGELLSPLSLTGLQFCPSLEEIWVKVDGDSRACPKPEVRVSGISAFASYPSLAKLILDCSGVEGYALSAPQGHWELSLWERWYLQGVDHLKLRELDYWPPQDRDVNRRGLSLPSAGLIAQCSTLRKLILHGTINEHLLRMFLKIFELRDVQLRLDYYPAPEVELNTETRVDACRRFEAALTERGFPD